ncbi:unnamed protein product [Ambrosiozyma monospora]|uniref:Unnamed protein product n=1 Tax=Ambrosiozyma monospora TaxID=43982 RepID=A0ACB5TFA4_AMBMO|nr:unnamed protein product [Ambrosiozyma monospora]
MNLRSMLSTFEDDYETNESMLMSAARLSMICQIINDSVASNPVNLLILQECIAILPYRLEIEIEWGFRCLLICNLNNQIVHDQFYLLTEFSTFVFIYHYLISYLGIARFNVVNSEFFQSSIVTSRTFFCVLKKVFNFVLVNNDVQFNDVLVNLSLEKFVTSYSISNICNLGFVMDHAFMFRKLKSVTVLRSLGDAIFKLNDFTLGSKLCSVFKFVIIEVDTISEEDLPKFKMLCTLPNLMFSVAHWDVDLSATADIEVFKSHVYHSVKTNNFSSLKKLIVTDRVHFKIGALFNATFPSLTAPIFELTSKSISKCDFNMLGGVKELTLDCTSDIESMLTIPQTVKKLVFKCLPGSEFQGQLIPLPHDLQELELHSTEWLSHFDFGTCPSLTKIRFSFSNDEERVNENYYSDWDLIPLSVSEVEFRFKVSK